MRSLIFFLKQLRKKKLSDSWYIYIYILNSSLLEGIMFLMLTTYCFLVYLALYIHYTIYSHVFSTTYCVIYTVISNSFVLTKPIYFQSGRWRELRYSSTRHMIILIYLQILTANTKKRKSLILKPRGPACMTSYFTSFFQSVSHEGLFCWL